MIVNQGNVDGLFRGYNTTFNKALAETTSHWPKIAMKVPSSASEESYSWLGDIPSIREWLGDRIVRDLSLWEFRIKNRTFEDTIGVKRTQVEDDSYGILAPKVQMMGALVAKHPEKLIFNLVRNGTTTLCYDKQYFFDTDHPVGVGSVANLVAGAGPYWYLLDGSQPLKPFIYQERIPFEFTSLTEAGSEVVFMKDEYLYGVRGRSNAGYGLWQLAYASGQELTATNYAAVRAAMMSQKGDNGEPIGVQPTHLLVPPLLEAAARKLLKELNTDGTNEWAASAELIVSPYLA